MSEHIELLSPFTDPGYEHQRCPHNDGPVFADNCADCLRRMYSEQFAEVRRLRGLVKSAETMGIPMGSETRNCPWCGYAHGDWKRKHSPECPAFTESGDVR